MSFSSKISSSEYSKLLFSIFLSEQWFWFVLPCILFIALGFLDIRFFIVAMMIFFIAIPMILALLYFNYMLTLETRWSIVDKKVDASERGLLLTFEDERSKPVMVNWNDISHAYTKDKYILFALKVRKYQYFVIPVNAFENKKQQDEFLLLVMNSLSVKS